MPRASHLTANWQALVVGNALEAIVTIDGDQRIVTFNPAAERMFGRAAADAVGRPLNTLVPERFWASHDDHVRTFAASGARVRDMSARLPVRGLRADGEEFPLEASLVRFETAGETRFGAILRDITDRSLAEEALQASEERFRATFEQAAIGIAHVAPDGRWLRVNERLCDIVGYSREELLELTFQDITHPDDLDTDLEYVRQMLDGERLSYSMDKRYLCKGGALVWINLTVSLVRNPSGDPDYFISVVEDISERKRTEAEVRILNAVSHAAREGSDFTSVLEVVMHRVCDAVGLAYAEAWIPSSDGSVLECTAAWWDPQQSFEVFHRATESLTFARGVGIPGRVWESGRPEWYEDITYEPESVIPRAPAAVAAGLGAALGVPVIADAQAVAVLVFFTREPRAEDTRLVAAIVTVASQLGTLLQRIKAEAEVRRLNQDLEARVERRTAELELANKELEAFSYTISHDLRAPLRAIDGFSRIIATEHGAGLDAEASRYFDLVRASAAQMSALIDDLLSFSRLSRQALDRRRIDHRSVVQAALAEVARVESPVAQVTVGQITPCEADPSLLKQVWVNLLSNAVKFSAGVERPEVEAGSFEREGETVYFVRDNGVGFDMQYAGKLFGVFQRLHRAEEYPGTGVGLAIVQRVVHRHGGRVWAESAPGRGATFYFTLGTTEPGE